MAETRRTRKKKSTVAKKSPRPKKPAIAVSLKRGVAGLIVLIALVLVLGVVVNQALKKKRPTKESVPAAAISQVPRIPIYPPVETRPPAFEIYTHIEPPAPVPTPGREAVPQPPQPGKLPRVAIIIDDIGYDSQIAEKFIGLNAAITLSILPHSPQQRQIVRMAREKGLDLMLHLPMEPLEYPAVNPGPGALLAEMTPDKLIRQLNDDLDAVQLTDQ